MFIRHLLFPLLRNHTDQQFCESVFDGHLLLAPNTQFITIVFIPRAMFSNEKLSKDKLGKLVVAGKEIADQPITYTEP